MASKSPVTVLYGYNGTSYVETTIRSGIAVPSGQPGILALGSDGTNTRIMRTATDGTVRIDPTGTTTQPISAASLPLPSGAATESTLATLLTTSAFQARINTLGQKTMANSTPVVISSDQSAIPASQSGTWNINNISGTISLPTGAATEATLVGLSAKFNTLGQKTMANSAPVVISSDQSAIPASQSGTWNITNISGTVSLPTGAATEATLAGVLTTSAFQARINTLGQKTMANSTPVVISSDQSEVQVKQGTAAALSGYWPVRITDGTNTRPTADVAARADFSKVTDGTNTAAVKAASTAPVAADPALVVTVSPNATVNVTSAASSEITFTVMSLRTTLSNNKSLLSVWNPTGSGVKLKLREFYIRNPQTSAVTGVAGDFRIYRFAKASAPTGGTTVNPVKHDSLDTLVASLDCRTGATAIGTEETDPMDRIIMSTDEWGPGPLDQEGAQQNISNYLPARAKRDEQVKAFTLNPGEGIHMKFATNSTAGTMDIIFVMTQV